MRSRGRWLSERPSNEDRAFGKVMQKGKSPKLVTLRRSFVAGHILWTEDELHTPIVGEDRNLGGNLLGYEPHGPDLPLLFDLLVPSVFFDLKRFVVRRAGFKCEVCGRTNFHRPFDRWVYDKRRKIRTLRRLMCLCKQCHIASLRKFDRPLHPLDPRDYQMRTFRGITHEQLEIYAAEQKKLHESLEKIKWKSDLSILTQRAYVGLPEPDDRLILNYPDPPIKPPADRIVVRFKTPGVNSPYRPFRSFTTEEPAMAEAKKLWPLLEEYTAKQISEITGIDLFRLHHTLGSRRVAAGVVPIPKATKLADEGKDKKRRRRKAKKKNKNP